jgi:hypothetical protein
MTWKAMTALRSWRASLRSFSDVSSSGRTATFVAVLSAGAPPRK